MLVRVVRWVECGWIKAHDGHPWNEMADAIWTDIAMNGLLLPGPSHRLGDWASDHCDDVLWAHLFVRTERSCVELPPTHDGCVLTGTAACVAMVGLPSNILGSALDVCGSAKDESDVLLKKKKPVYRKYESKPKYRKYESPMYD